jgi:hypothetical protein
MLTLLAQMIVSELEVKDPDVKVINPFELIGPEQTHLTVSGFMLKLAVAPITFLTLIKTESALE